LAYDAWALVDTDMRYVGIDPSTKTGLVIIDEDGEVWEATEITHEGKDPERMIHLIGKTMKHIGPDDIIAIEGFAFGAKGAAVGTMYGIGWGMRMDFFRCRVNYTEVSPSAVKKFASGKGNTKKDELGVEIYKRWGFEHKSDNVRDAYVLAQIARAMHEQLKLTAFQQDVITGLLVPKEKKSRRNAG